MNEYISKLKNHKWFKKIFAKLSDGTIDTEHYIAVYYCFAIMVPLFVTGIGIQLVGYSPFTFLKWFIILILIIVNACLFFVYGKKMICYFKNKRFMLGLLSFSTVSLFLSFSLAWFYVFSANVSNLLNSWGYVANQGLNILHPEKLLIQSIDYFVKTGQGMVIFSQVIGFSFLLNIIVPKQLQMVDIPVRKKILRALFKIGGLFFLALVTAALLFVNKDNFAVVTAAWGVITFLSSPKLIIDIFSNRKDVANITISSDITKAFSLIRLFLGELYFSWIISIYAFPNNLVYRVNMFAIMVSSLVVITVFIRIYLQSKGKDLFSKWVIVENKDSESTSKKN